jgi:trehalose utilization protein
MLSLLRLKTLGLWSALFLAFSTFAAPQPIRVLIWDEQQPDQKKAYGEYFLGETIAAHLSAQPGLVVKTASLTDPDQGLSDATLAATDVVVLWCHRRVKDQSSERMAALAQRVMAGKTGYVALHSAHWSKTFVQLMQERAKADALLQVPEAERGSVTWQFLNDNPIYGKMPPKGSPNSPFVTHEGKVWKLTLPHCVFPTWRADGAPSHVRTLLPEHPIAKGLPATWDIPHTEMYGEPFWVPKPDAVIFEEKWDKGEFFRSGALWKVGAGDVFYFRPGHETYGVYQQAENLRVVENAVRWMGAEVQRR